MLWNELVGVEADLALERRRFRSRDTPAPGFRVGLRSRWSDASRGSVPSVAPACRRLRRVAVRIGGQLDRLAQKCRRLGHGHSIRTNRSPSAPVFCTVRRRLSQGPSKHRVKVMWEDSDVPKEFAASFGGNDATISTRTERVDWSVGRRNSASSTAGSMTSWPAAAGRFCSRASPASARRRSCEPPGAEPFLGARPIVVTPIPTAASLAPAGLGAVLGLLRSQAAPTTGPESDSAIRSTRAATKRPSQPLRCARARSRLAAAADEHRSSSSRRRHGSTDLREVIVAAFRAVLDRVGLLARLSGRPVSAKFSAWRSRREKSSANNSSRRANQPRCCRRLGATGATRWHSTCSFAACTSPKTRCPRFPSAPVARLDRLAFRGRLEALPRDVVRFVVLSADTARHRPRCSRRGELAAIWPTSIPPRTGNACRRGVDCLAIRSGTSAGDGDALTAAARARRPAAAHDAAGDVSLGPALAVQHGPDEVAAHALPT